MKKAEDKAIWIIVQCLSCVKSKILGRFDNGATCLVSGSLPILGNIPHRIKVNIRRGASGSGTRRRIVRAYISSFAYSGSSLLLHYHPLILGHSVSNRFLYNPSHTLVTCINSTMIGMKSLATFATVISVVYAAAVPAPEDEWHYALLKRQAPGSPAFACHEACGKYMYWLEFVHCDCMF